MTSVYSTKERKKEREMGYEAPEQPLESKASRGLEVLLRTLAIVLSVAGAVVMATDKQVETVFIGPVPVDLQARHSYVEAFVFLVYANGIVAIYSFISLVLSFVVRGHGLAGLLFLMDQALAYLLLAAAAASAEVAYIAKRGEDNIKWTEVCSNFHRFCNVVGGALVLTFLCVLVLIALAILSSKRLFVQRPSYTPPTATIPPRQGVRSQEMTWV